MSDQLTIENCYTISNVTIDTCIKDFLNDHYGSHIKSLQPKKIIFNGPATIVMWNDGTKTVVKQSKFDDYDYEKGFAMCVVKKVFGDQYNAIRKMVVKSYEDTITETIDKANELFLTKFKPIKPMK